MKLNKNAQIAIAVGWFVLTSILLTTTQGAANTATAISSIVRGLLRGFGFNYFILGIGIIGLITIVLLVFLLLIYLIRAWTSTINLTRVLVKYYFFDSTTNSEESDQEGKMVRNLFGENTLTSRNALLWLSLRSLLAIWIIVIVISIISGIVNVLSAY